MKYIIFTGIVLLILYFSTNVTVERYKNNSYLDYDSLYQNYRNAVFLTRPPYKRAYDYIPYANISPAFIYKHNFLPFPIEGFDTSFTNEGFSVPQSNEGFDTLFTNEGFDTLSSSDPTSNISNLIDQVKSVDIPRKTTEPTNQSARQSAVVSLPKTEFEKKLRFFTSDKCGPGYDYTGAFFSMAPGEDKIFNCNVIDNIASDFKPATAVASVKDGKIDKIIVTDPGRGYGEIPYVKITGKGSGADAMILLEKGEVKSINVMNGGSGYVDTPNVSIERIGAGDGCYLCVEK